MMWRGRGLRFTVGLSLGKRLNWDGEVSGRLQVLTTGWRLHSGLRGQRERRPALLPRQLL